ncbi:MAG: hypothetical protein ACLQLC_13665 [Candidatus Sulfotelmatobacter sp.]
MTTIRHCLGCWMVVAAVAYAAFGQRSDGVVESLAAQCDEKPFLSVAAHTRERNVIPTIDLTLSDPSHRMQGKDVRGTVIPESRYGGVVQIPSMANRSTVLAIEVCNAERGVYEIQVKEHGDEPYGLDVTAIDPETHETMLLHHIAQDGRVLRYKFIFKLDGKKHPARETSKCGELPCAPDFDAVMWLDSQGYEQMRIEDNDW